MFGGAQGIAGVGYCIVVGVVLVCVLVRETMGTRHPLSSPPEFSIATEGVVTEGVGGYN